MEFTVFSRFTKARAIGWKTNSRVDRHAAIFGDTILPFAWSYYQSRSFAKTRQKKNTPPRKKDVRDKPKHFASAPKPPKTRVVRYTDSTSFIPPLMMLPTASKFAYVASAAIPEGSDIDPRSIFADIVDDHSPSLEPFAGMAFEYFPPKSFQHKLPDPETNLIPEIAFLGRSNVGKSSLINAMMGRDLATCSKHPGRTQQPYYYGIVPKSLFSTRLKNTEIDPMSSQGFIVDLPGYGFAKAPNKAVETWQRHTQQFLRDRRELGTLRRLFLLIDARRGLGQVGGSTALDQSVMHWLDDSEIPYSVIITKADCVNAAHLVKVTNEVCMRYQQQHQEEEQILSGEIEPDDEYVIDGWMGPVVHITSAKNADGIKELRSTVEAELSVIEE